MYQIRRKTIFDKSGNDQDKRFYQKDNPEEG